MSGKATLQGLLARASSSPDAAERERAYEELVRLLLILVRARLGARLRDRRESMDVCQSLARSFVEDLTTGRIVFESEAALVAYLRKAVGSKIADLARMDSAARRGGGARDVALDAAASGGPFIADTGPGASTIVSDREMHARLLDSLDPEERELAALRRRGMGWDQIAQELGSSAVVLRKRWSRLQQRLTEQFEQE